jgi:predicted phage baseplate assembly protein
MEIRSRYRAVTAEDFEFMAGEASPRVARAVCIPPRDGGAVPLHLVPRIYPADRRLDFAELMPEEELLTEVAEYLDERRLIGTTIELKPCRYRGLSVVVNLQARPLADTARVEEDVAHALYTYLNPLVGGNPTGPGAGWPFGRALNQGELYGVVHAVDGVEFVRILRLYETNLETGEQSAKPAGTHIVLEPDELMASGLHIVKATHRED